MSLQLAVKKDVDVGVNPDMTNGSQSLGIGIN
jgi:hypothetical protein